MSLEWADLEWSGFGVDLEWLERPRHRLWMDWIDLAVAP